MLRFASALVLCLAALVGGCTNASQPGQSNAAEPRATQQDGQPIFITLQVQQHLKKYYGQVSGGQSGAFAVSEKGTVGFYAYCQGVNCRDDVNFSSQALKGCEARGVGKCVILAVGSSVRRPYMTYQEAEEKGLLTSTTP